MLKVNKVSIEQNLSISYRLIDAFIGTFPSTGTKHMSVMEFI